MTPDFALSLSFDGIRLLLRTAEGWTPLGEVPLDSPDLAGGLAALRRMGLQAGVHWHGTLLLLPAEQVKVLALDGELGEVEVLRALDGATPYPLTELVVDFQAVEGRTHVAAVARETLEEAEAFAADHGFRPARFGASLPGTSFPGEVDFGPARGVVSVLAEGTPPFEETSPNPVAQAAAATGVAPGVEGGDEASPASNGGPRTHEALEAASSASEAAGGFVPAPDVISVETVAAVASPTGVTSKEGSATARTDPSSEASLELTVPEESVPEVAPNATPVLRAEAPQLIVSSRLPPRLPVGADGHFPQGSSPATNVSPERGSPTSSGGSPLSVSSAGRSDQRLPPRVSAPEGNSLSAATAAPLPAAPDRPLRRVAFGSSPGAAQSATSKVDGRFGLRSLGEPIGARTIVRPKYLGLLLPLILLGMIAVVALLANVTPGTVVGLFRGSLPTAAAPVVAQEVAAPEAEVAARPLQDQPVAAAVRPAADSAEAQATGLVLDVEDAAAAAAAVAAAMTAPQTEHPSAGAERGSGLAAQPAPTDSSVPTADAERIYAATGLWLDAPRLPGLPEAAGTTAEAPALGTLSMDKALAELPSLAALSPDPSLSAPIDPPLPGQSLAQGGDTPVAFTPDGAVAPSGPPVHAGSPALLPPSLPGEPSAAESMPTPTGWVNAIAEPPSRTPPDRPAVPEGFGATVAAADAVQGPPAPASAEAGAAWVNSLAEPPSVSPRARPDLPVEALAALASAAPPEVDPTAELGGALALAAPETEGPSLGAVSLDGLRPMSRPADLEPAEPPVQVLTSFEGPRPGARPEGLAPEAPDVTDALAEALAAPEAPPTEEPVRAPDLQSTLAAIVEGAPDPLAGATRLAVAAARVPEGRPRNFDRVVREQLESVASARAAQEERRPNGGGEGTSLEEHEAAESDGNAEVASSAAAAPSGPTATTVAAAATLSDAMALREINLIGVYGQPGARRALVRMDNGRYLRVGIGDNLDGGQVTAIGDNALNYVRRGRTEVLVIPGG